MTIEDIFDLITDVDEKDISKGLMRELVFRAYKQGRKDQIKDNKEIKSELGYSRVGKDAMKRG
jgi:Asp-tRNA(Asn)/Glu-tRNA(Gln) amidotransferase B subunit